jgi:HEAT repeat protein
MNAAQHLSALFDADRAGREAETALLQSAKGDALSTLLSEAVDDALGLGDRREGAMRLERLADLCAQVPGPAMADALIRILGADDPAVRVAAGEAILDVGYERYAEIARAIERALDAGTTGPAMAELPYVLAEIGEPSALPLIRRFLSSADAETVAAGIEAIASIGDPAALEDLARLEGDDRVVDVGDLDEGGSVTIGELVEAAIEEIEPRESR